MSGLRTRLGAAGDDRGVTLVETIVYCAILVIALPLAGTILVDALTSQRDVQGVTQAGAVVQTVTRSLELGVRNASAVSSVVVRPVGTTGQNDELVLARTQVATDPPTWLCQAWYYDAAADVLYTRSVPTTSANPVIAMPPSGSAPSWTALAEAVTPNPPGSPVFAAWTGGLSIDLTSSAGARTPVVLSTAVAKRTQWQTGSQPCF